MKEFIKKATETVKLINSIRVENALVIYHDDADGISAGAIISTTLNRMGLNVNRICLEKLLPEVVREIHSSKRRTHIFYCDIGSPHCDMISQYNNGRNLTIILDHHDPKPSIDPMVIDLNLENFGFKGESDFSGSTCSFLFAKVISDENIDLSYLAITGSIEIPEGIRGINSDVLSEALRNKIILRKNEKLYVPKINMFIDDLFSKLQILGSAGYYRGGPELGIKLCLNGETEEISKVVKELESKRKNANKKMLSKLYSEGIKQSKYTQWFDANDIFSGMGTKTIGTFCSYLSYQKKIINPNKFIVGFINMSSEIPGFGEIKEKYVKISIRAPEPLKSKIDDGIVPSAINILSVVVNGHGIADGHTYAASAIVYREYKDEIIRKIDYYIDKYKDKRGTKNIF
ncbi:MAG: DHH family phosphoesterase [Candidatus Methanomethylicia archaeon]